jgi:hypothetical protein
MLGFQKSSRDMLWIPVHTAGITELLASWPLAQTSHFSSAHSGCASQRFWHVFKMSMNHLGNIKPWFNDSLQVLLNYKFNILDIFLHFYRASETPEAGEGTPEIRVWSQKAYEGRHGASPLGLASYLQNGNNANKWEKEENAVAMVINLTVLSAWRVLVQGTDGMFFQTGSTADTCVTVASWLTSLASVASSVKWGTSFFLKGLSQSSNEIIRVKCLAQCLLDTQWLLVIITSTSTIRTEFQWSGMGMVAGPCCMDYEIKTEVKFKYFSCT